MVRLEILWDDLRSSFWFVPSLIFLVSIALALGLIELDSGRARPWIEQWPRVFGSGAAGARGMLSTIASSMMTVVGITFSMTLVTLALASSQYTSRILRNFMADRITQVVLGTFGGIFIYCLIVLRTIRGGDEDYVPSLAVFFGVVLAIGGTAILIFFIHHIASGIQASSIIESVTKQTLCSIDRQYPEQDDAGDGPVGGEARSRTARAPECGTQKVVATHIGYIQSIDVAALVRIAHENDVVVRIERGVGEFAVHGAALASVSSSHSIPGKLADAIERAFILHRFRTIDQDARFGIRQIVDIALRALSPSVNDTTTGAMCVDYLSAILSHLADRTFPARERYCEGELRVVTIEQTFAGLLADAFDQIRGNARGNLTVLARILVALRATGGRTSDQHRRKALVDYVSSMREMLDSLPISHERAQFESALEGAQLALAVAPPSTDPAS
jgi:uncharacterized membrane protein